MIFSIFIVIFGIFVAVISISDTIKNAANPIPKFDNHDEKRISEITVRKTRNINY